ncbi:MAG: polysaccharide deacetylase [Clostridiaceae bacterium]|jgi:peptidoglycan/xylan/chitin deacetylase (PgdA/CDA1 family)|nr:polysaccharide deacetylase [Clostridiaceae bacterium]
MSKDRMRWPKGKTCAVMISVNLEAEYFAKMYYPDEDIDLASGEVAALGWECMTFGLPKILNALDAHGIKATFFILAAVADKYPEAVKEIASKGHEIGCHGYYHENLALLSLEDQRSVLKKAKDRLEEVCGKEVKGFRMPEGEMTEGTLKIVKDLGFNYSSSLSDDDVPYLREESQIIELPIHWELYDLPYFVYTWDPQIPQGQCRSANANDVLENWKIELEGALKYGTLFNLQLDPQATGEQGRIFILEELLDLIVQNEDIWMATGEEIADYFENSQKNH